jgi:hypothetical protein
LIKHLLDMNKAEIKAAILEAMSAEIDQWLDRQDTIRSGYEYETEFMKVAQQLNKLLLEKSVGKVPGSRNKKKDSIPVSGK